MRLFLAVNPGDQLRQELATRLDPVRRRLAQGRTLRWTKPENWHLTLQFLDDWPDDRIPGLEQGLRQLAGSGGFDLTPGALGAFPDFIRPRVLFVHLDSQGKAERLAAKLRETVAGIWPAGPQDSKPWRAHLTVARVRGKLDPGQLDILQSLDLQGLPGAEVRDFKLMASVLLPGGAEHRELAVVPLKRA